MAKRQQHKETALVRMLTYVLGVNPGEFRLVPDPEGWAPVKELLKALHEQEGWRGVRESMIQDAVARLAPGEFALEGKKIRCLTRSPQPPEINADPPAHLYVGVRRRAWPVVKTKGLAAGAAGPVLLLADREQALRLGRRRDADPVAVTVQTRWAQDKGAVFSLLGEDLFLCDWIPADCLMGPPLPERAEIRKPTKAKKKEPKPTAPPRPEAMPGSFFVTTEDMEKPYKRKGIKKQIKWKDERRKGRRKSNS